MFSSLKVRNYRLFFLGQVVSNIGTWMQRIAQDWLVLELSGYDPVALGVAATLQFAPTLVLTLWAGVLADLVGQLDEDEWATLRAAAPVLEKLAHL